MTTRPCDTRADSPAGWCALNSAIWRCWIAAKSHFPSVSRSLSSGLMMLLVSRFRPCSAAHCVERLLPAPYQMRSPSPGECGSTRAENSSKPWVPENVLTGSPRTIRSSRATRS